MRTVFSVVMRVAFGIAGCSLAYLLFMLGHTETVSPGRTFAVTVVGGLSALVAGLLYWVGLPATGSGGTGKMGQKKPMSTGRK